MANLRIIRKYAINNRLISIKWVRIYYGRRFVKRAFFLFLPVLGNEVFQFAYAFFGRNASQEGEHDRFVHV